MSSTLINTLTLVMLIMSTIQGLKWFLRITNPEKDFEDGEIVNAPPKTALNTTTVKGVSLDDF